MAYGIVIGAVLSIIVGILILVFPALLRWIIGIYLIVAGLLALTGW